MTTSRFSRLKPMSVARIPRRLRTNSADPASSVSEIATCTTMSARARRARRTPTVCLPIASRIGPGSIRDARAIGASVKAAVEATAASALKANTRRSGEMASTTLS